MSILSLPSSLLVLLLFEADCSNMRSPSFLKICLTNVPTNIQSRFLFSNHRLSLIDRVRFYDNSRTSFSSRTMFQTSTGMPVEVKAAIYSRDYDNSVLSKLVRAEGSGGSLEDKTNPLE